MRILTASPRILAIMSDDLTGVPRESMLGSRISTEDLSRHRVSRSGSARVPAVARNWAISYIFSLLTLSGGSIANARDSPCDDLEPLFGDRAPSARPCIPGSCVDPRSMTPARYHRADTRPVDHRRPGLFDRISSNGRANGSM